MPIGTALRELRVSQRLTQREVARRAAISPVALCELEKNHRKKFNLAAVARVAAVLGTTMPALLLRVRMEDAG